MKNRRTRNFGNKVKPRKQFNSNLNKSVQVINNFRCKVVPTNKLKFRLDCFVILTP